MKKLLLGSVALVAVAAGRWIHMTADDDFEDFVTVLH
jgi:hypothetical protein